LEEVKSVEKCQCGKKRDKFPWKNITYLVVASSTTSAYLGSMILIVEQRPSRRVI
jgi:hypothetical protein